MMHFGAAKWRRRGGCGMKNQEVGEYNVPPYRSLRRQSLQLHFDCSVEWSILCLSEFWMPVIEWELNTPIVYDKHFGCSRRVLKITYLPCNYFHQVVEQFVPSRRNPCGKEQPGAGWQQRLHLPFPWRQLSPGTSCRARSGMLRSAPATSARSNFPCAQSGAGAAQPCSLPPAGARPSASLAISSRGGGIPPPIPFSASASAAAAPWWSCSPRPRSGSWWLCRRSAPRSWMQLFLRKKVKYFSLRLLAVLCIFLVLLYFCSVKCIFLCVDKIVGFNFLPVFCILYFAHWFLIQMLIHAFYSNSFVINNR